MALPDLASGADLTARGIESDTNTLTMLGVASTIVRGAAGSPILTTESTVTLTGWGERLLNLPGKPVTAVSSVTINEEDVAYTLLDGQLFRAQGWGTSAYPVQVVVTLTHGFAAVPEDIIDLVCNLAVAGAAELAAGGGSHDPRVLIERIDDYQVQFAAGAESFASVMELPAGTRRMLSSRFGGSAQMVTHR